MDRVFLDANVLFTIAGVLVMRPAEYFARKTADENGR